MEYLLIIFFIYSCIGWAAEVAEEAVNTNSFVNRGFLNGPICPIYGVGIVLMTVCLEAFDDQLLILFLGCGAIGTALEYITSILLEKITHIRWWDYSNQPLQFQGRICLPFSAFWAFAGMLCLKINQFFAIRIGRIQKQYDFWSHIQTGILILCGIVLILDILGTIVTVLSLQNKFKRLGVIEERIRSFSHGIGNWIYENVYIRKMRAKLKQESEEVRRRYKKEREQKLLKVLEKRMILAAPDMAPDQETLERIEREQKKKKRRLFTRIMLSRVLWTGICILAEIVWIAVLLTKFAKASATISICLTLLSACISLYIVSKNENSAYKIGWIMIIMSLPVFGGLLYIFMGNKNPSRAMRLQIKKVHQEIKEYLVQNSDVESELQKKEERMAGSSRYLYSNTDYPVWEHTKTKYFPVGEFMFADMLEELKKAEHFIFLEYFIVEDGIFWGSILEILKEKVKAGVDVRVIYDDVGCLMLLPKHYKIELEEAGIQCIAFNPFNPVFSMVMNNRDHRKIMVIDGHTAYTGGINLADEYINVIDRYGHWKDTGMKFYGEAAANFTLMFLEMWNAFRKTDDDYSQYLPHVWHPEPFEGEGFVQPFSDTPLDDEPTAENIYIDILNQASRYVYIFTPYLIISDTMRHALCMAAGRGVDVKIITPGVPDKKVIYRLTRSNYKELLKAGVEIYEYTPGFLHAKSYVSDDRIAVIGSINMDYRSLYLHFECGAYLYQTDSIMEMKDDVEITLKQSRKVELIHLKQGILERIFDAVLSIISPLV